MHRTVSLSKTLDRFANDPRVPEWRQLDNVDLPWVSGSYYAAPLVVEHYSYGVSVELRGRFGK